MRIVRELAFFAAACTALGCAPSASAAPDPATCQAVKPVLDEIMAAALATRKSTEQGDQPGLPQGPGQESGVLDHYLRAAAAARRAADTTSDPHTSDLLRRMSVVLDAVGTGKGPGRGQRLPVEEKDGEELGNLEKGCGFTPERKRLGLGE
ncbi:MAG: hypothetical protein ACRC20_03295 [Segniliparus sp.]|uniref:hypothetical protein n=1 Tax=Segniliparus sp. TaxID=2804064 RepID=UPI003F3EBBDD